MTIYKFTFASLTRIAGFGLLLAGLSVGNLASAENLGQTARANDKHAKQSHQSAQAGDALRRSQQSTPPASPSAMKRPNQSTHSHQPPVITRPPANDYPPRKVSHPQPVAKSPQPQVKLETKPVKVQPPKVERPRPSENPSRPAVNKTKPPVLVQKPGADNPRSSAVQQKPAAGLGKVNGSLKGNVRAPSTNPNDYSKNPKDYVPDPRDPTKVPPGLPIPGQLGPKPADVWGYCGATPKPADTQGWTWRQKSHKQEGAGGLVAVPCLGAGCRHFVTWEAVAKSSTLPGSGGLPGTGGVVKNPGGKSGGWLPGGFPGSGGGKGFPTKPPGTGGIVKGPNGTPGGWPGSGGGNGMPTKPPGTGGIVKFPNGTPGGFPGNLPGNGGGMGIPMTLPNAGGNGGLPTISPPQLPPIIQQAGSAASGGAEYYGGQASGGVKYYGGQASGGAKYYGGQVASGSKYYGAQTSQGAKYYGGEISRGGKHYGKEVGTWDNHASKWWHRDVLGDHEFDDNDRRQLLRSFGLKPDQVEIWFQLTWRGGLQKSEAKQFNRCFLEQFTTALAAGDFRNREDRAKALGRVIRNSWTQFFKLHDLPSSGWPVDARLPGRSDSDLALAPELDGTVTSPGDGGTSERQPTNSGGETTTSEDSDRWTNKKKAAEELVKSAMENFLRSGFTKLLEAIVTKNQIVFLIDQGIDYSSATYNAVDDTHLEVARKWDPKGNPQAVGTLGGSENEAKAHTAETGQPTWRTPDGKWVYSEDKNYQPEWYTRRWYMDPETGKLTEKYGKYTDADRTPFTRSEELSAGAVRFVTDKFEDVMNLLVLLAVPTDPNQKPAWPGYVVLHP